ncbi:MAG: outer membrane protein [Bauldia sp.]
MLRRKRACHRCRRGSALAADLSQPNYAPPPAQAYNAAPAWSWTGPYAGLTGGYGWGTVSNSGWIGGAYAGYNLQTNQNLVIGFEGDATFTGKSGSNGTGTVKNPWDATFRGRVGYTWGNTLLYGTAGVAAGEVKGSGGYTGSVTKVGWTAGVGLEHAFTDTVTGRVEYRHTDLGTANLAPSSVSYSSNDVLVGIGVKF